MQEILQQLGYLEKMTFSLSNHAVTFHLQRWPGEDFSHEIFGLGIILSPPLNASNLLNWYLQLQVTVFFLMMGSSHVESKVWKKHSFVEKIKDAPAAHLKKNRRTVFASNATRATLTWATRNSDVGQTKRTLTSNLTRKWSSQSGDEFPLVWYVVSTRHDRWRV